MEGLLLEVGQWTSIGVRVSFLPFTLSRPCALPVLLLPCPDVRLTFLRRFLRLLPDRFTLTIEQSWTVQTLAVGTVPALAYQS